MIHSGIRRSNSNKSASASAGQGTMTASGNNNNAGSKQLLSGSQLTPTLHRALPEPESLYIPSQSSHHDKEDTKTEVIRTDTPCGRRTVGIDDTFAYTSTSFVRGPFEFFESELRVPKALPSLTSSRGLLRLENGYRTPLSNKNAKSTPVGLSRSTDNTQIIGRSDSFFWLRKQLYHHQNDECCTLPSKPIRLSSHFNAISSQSKSKADDSDLGHQKGKPFQHDESEKTENQQRNDQDPRLEGELFHLSSEVTKKKAMIAQPVNKSTSDQSKNSVTNASIAGSTQEYRPSAKVSLSVPQSYLDQFDFKSGDRLGTHLCSYDSAASNITKCNEKQEDKSSFNHSMPFDGKQHGPVLRSTDGDDTPYPQRQPSQKGLARAMLGSVPGPGVSSEHHKNKVQPRIQKDAPVKEIIDGKASPIDQRIPPSVIQPSHREVGTTQVTEIRPFHSEAPPPFSRWTPSEDNLLRHAIKVEGGPPISWKFISWKYFQARRNPNQCKGRWTKVSGSGGVRERLLAMVISYSMFFFPH